MVSQGLRYNTKRTYSSAQKQYLQFCTIYELQPLPATEQVILWYLAYLKTKKNVHSKKIGISAKSMVVYLSALRSLHVMHGLEVPPTCTPRINLAVKSVIESDGPPNQREPITYDLLQAMCGLIDDKKYDGKLWKAVLTLGFFGCLRGAELCAVYDFNSSILVIPPPVVGAVSFGVVNELKFIKFVVPKSKNNVNGFEKFIGCSGTDICACCAMYSYLEYRSKSNVCVSESPLFILQFGDIFCKKHLNKGIKALVTELGLKPDGYSSHSLRSGNATTSAFKKFNDYEISQAGMWRSDAYKTYIRPLPINQIKNAHRLANN